MSYDDWKKYNTSEKLNKKGNFTGKKEEQQNF